MEKKERVTLEKIKAKIESLKDDPEGNVAELKVFFTDPEYKDIKKDITNLLVQELKKMPTAEYKLTYDSLGEGLEPIYFWILDFLRDRDPSGLGLEVFKGQEEFEASVASGYFSELGTKGTQMQAKAMEYLGAINQVIKSILNLIYDLKEFETRVEQYNKLHSTSVLDRKGASNALKGTWMDQVDVKKGKGSINLLAQDLGFVTIRDAFFYVDDVGGIERLDLNERVKNILHRKMSEYKSWLEMSEKEIKKRYNIEKAYLKSQYATLKLYAGWLKPYLMAAQKLKMKEFNTPTIVNAFSNMELRLSILGQKEIKPTDLHQSYKNIKLDKKYYAVVEVVMDFRGLPSAMTVQGARQYVHGGRADLQFKAYAVDEVEMNVLRSKELYEDLDLINDYVDSSLKELQSELDKYINPQPEAEKKHVKKKWENPLKGTIDGLKEITKPLTDPLQDAWKKQAPGEMVKKDVMKHGSDRASRLCFLVYNMYKRAHGMLAA